LKDYITRFPDGKDIPAAKDKLAKAQNRLAAHDLYVARFYRRLKKDAGAAGRYEYIRAHFPDSQEASAVLLELGETYVRMGADDKAKAAFAQLIEQHPDAVEVAKAREILNHLGY
jgi:outer membrane protein assembly factor BamD